MAPQELKPSIEQSRVAFTRRALFVVLASLLGFCGVDHPANANSPPDFRIIVHKSYAPSAASREFLADAFLKKVTRWDSGEAIRPVDQRSTSAVRRAFSESVLKRSTSAVSSYWQQRIFSGRDVPPPELDSDENVVDYVARHSGAVGYVSGNAKLGDTKEIQLQ